jgi:hypothetical protein
MGRGGGVPRDRSIANNNKLFTILVLPTQGAGCNSPNGAYDVVVVSGGNPGTAGATESMARAATAQGMKFYAGMPIPAKRTDLAYLPDLSYQNTFSVFINRYLQYHAKTNNVRGLAGFYLSTDIAIEQRRCFRLGADGLQNTKSSHPGDHAGSVRRREPLH